MWDETNAVKREHTIRRETQFASGPHIYCGTPLFKTPRAKCTLNGDYDLLDLIELPEDYLPRTNYVPDCETAVYRAAAGHIHTVLSITFEEHSDPVHFGGWVSPILYDFFITTGRGDVYESVLRTLPIPRRFAGYGIEYRGVPGPEAKSRLNPLGYASVAEYLTAQRRLWGLPMEVALADALHQHGFCIACSILRAKARSRWKRLLRA